MKSYYHTHEGAYKSIQARGLAGWGDAATLADLGDAVTFEALRKSVQAHFSHPQEMKALDLGSRSLSTLRFDENYILWNKTKDLSLRGSEIYEGEAWCVQRWVPPASYIEAELVKCGFKILSSEQSDPTDPNHPDKFWVVAQ